MDINADLKTRAIWVTLIASASVGLSLTAFYVGLPPARSFASSLFLPVIGFAVFAYAGRWFVLRNRAARGLSDRFLIIAGSIKIALFLALFLLALECVIGAIFWPGSGPVMLGTFVTGLVAFATLNIALGAVVNSLMVMRKLLQR